MTGLSAPKSPGGTEPQPVPVQAQHRPLLIGGDPPRPPQSWATTGQGLAHLLAGVGSPGQQREVAGYVVTWGLVRPHPGPWCSVGLCLLRGLGDVLLRGQSAQSWWASCSANTQTHRKGWLPCQAHPQHPRLSPPSHRCPKGSPRPRPSSEPHLYLQPLLHLCQQMPGAPNLHPPGSALPLLVWDRTRR